MHRANHFVLASQLHARALHVSISTVAAAAAAAAGTTVPQKDIFTLLSVNKNSRNVAGAPLLKIPVLDKGFVRIVDCMPRLITADATGGDGAIAAAARVSYVGGDADASGIASDKVKKKTEEEDRRLIRFLMRHKHTSPFEMAEVTFHVKAPVFVARQWFRHRTANVNEWSARYSEMPAEYYEPTLLRKQSASNKQMSEAGGGGGVFIDDEAAHGEFAAAIIRTREAHAAYERLAGDHGVAREQARIGLPVAMYTQFYWKCDLHNLMNFLRLRMAADAQPEIQAYASAMMRLVSPLFPATFEAFDDYVLSAETFSRAELNALRAFFITHMKPFNGEAFCSGSDESKSHFPDATREQKEFVAKRNRIFLAPRFWHEA